MTEGWKPATGQKIERLYAWVAVEPDGGEGLMGGELMGPGNGFIPMIGADTARIESLRPLAVALAKEAGVPLRLVEYSVRRDIESHDP